MTSRMQDLKNMMKQQVCECGTRGWTSSRQANGEAHGGANKETEGHNCNKTIKKLQGRGEAESVHSIILSRL